MDESHSNSLSFRCKEYAGEIISFALQLILYLGISFLISLAVSKLLSKNGKDWNIFLKPSLSILLLFTIILLSINHLFFSILGDTNQFYLYFRFLVIVLFGITCATLSKNNTKEYLFLGIIPGILSVLASAVVTNMSFEIALARIYIAVMASCFIVGNLLHVEYQQNKFFKNLLYVATVFYLLSLLMCKLLLIRVTGCIPISIKMHMAPVIDGPAAGLFLKEELAQLYNENTAFFKENVTDKDLLLYFGCENIYYLIVNAELSTPSTQGTAVFNEMYLYYYEKYPEKIPNIVIIDKNFEIDPAYNYSGNNQIILNWIMEEFKNATIIETDNLILLRNN